MNAEQFLQEALEFEQEILEQNKQERHLRGGDATRQKYLNRQGSTYPEKASLK